jgi:hypothetical protein
MSGDRYQITLHAENLPNGRWFGKSCPYAEIKITSGPQQGTIVGKTETIHKELSPEWAKIFLFDFSDSEVTNLEITIYDDYNKPDDKDGYREPKWLGEANFEATSVFQSPGKTQSNQIGRSPDSRYV